MNDLPVLTSADRAALLGHKPAVLWFTGLSGSGKSTLAQALESRLHQHYRALTYQLDGDVIRTGLNRDLDFTPAGRQENVRRIGEVSRLFYDAGLIVLTTFISPFRADRDAVRALIPPGGFIEIYVSASLEVCEARDVKGLYRKARAGLIPHFTGIGSPYEPPLRPEINVDTAALPLEDCVFVLENYLLERGIIQTHKSKPLGSLRP